MIWKSYPKIYLKLNPSECTVIDIKIGSELLRQLTGRSRVREPMYEKDTGRDDTPDLSPENHTSGRVFLSVFSCFSLPLDLSLSFSLSLVFQESKLSSNRYYIYKLCLGKFLRHTLYSNWHMRHQVGFLLSYDTDVSEGFRKFLGVGMDRDEV